MRGPKPTPTFIRQMRGNPSKRPMNQNEPKAPPGIPAAPRCLSKTAMGIWGEVIKLLASMGMSSRADCYFIEQLSVAIEESRAATNQIRRHGLFVRMGKVKIANPAIAVRIKAAKRIEVFGSALGLSPSARTRISTIPLGWAAPPIRDQFDEFMEPAGDDDEFFGDRKAE